MLSDNAGKIYNCTKAADYKASDTKCDSVTLTDLEDMTGANTLNISASFTGNENRVYTCSVSVDGVEDRKMIYAEKIVTSAYITHSDNEQYLRMHVSNNIQYATKTITTANCGVYNNNINPKPTIKMTLNDTTVMSIPREFAKNDAVGTVAIRCDYTFDSANVTISSTKEVFLVEKCDPGHITNSDGGCSSCVDGYRPAALSQFEPCVPCEVGKGPSKYMSECAACTEAGQYSVYGKKCDVCPNGTTPNAARTTCEPCAIGYAGIGGICTICKTEKDATGTIYEYAAIVGQTACTACNQLVICNQTADSSCTGCKACDIGQTAKDGQCDSKVCAAGQVKNSVSGMCIPCMPGKYESNGSCIDCLAGQYQPEAGQQSCKSCFDANTDRVAMYQPETGKSYCYAVKPGYSLDNSHPALPEKICPAGSYSGGGAANCTKCDADNKEFSPQAGASFCSQCTIGKVVGDGTNCGGVYCPEDQYVSKQVTKENTTYVFSKTSANSLNDKQVECNTSDAEEYITRFCRYNEEDSSAEWMDPNFGQCSSANSAALSAMITMDIENATAVAENSKQMKKMAEDVSTLLPNDISLIATSLGKIGNLSVDKIDAALVDSVTSTIGSLADSGDKLKSVAKEKKAELVSTLEAMAMASDNPDGVQENTVAIKKIDPKNVSLPMPKNMDVKEKPSLDLGDIGDENASVAIFDAGAKDLFPEPAAEVDPTGINPVKKKEVGSCIVSLNMKVKEGDTFKLSLSSKNKEGKTDSEVYGSNMLVQRDCHYLDVADSTWKVDGCITSLNKDTKFYECKCNHTTSFAILLSISEIKDTLQDDVSTVMQSINLIFLILTFLCLAPFKKFNTRRLMQIQIQLVLSLIFANLAFLILGAVSTVKLNENKRPLLSLNVGCAVGIIIVEYLFLAVMAWMTCAAVTLYGKIVEALKTYGKIDRFYFTKCMVGCWGIPLVLPVASLLTSYSINDMEYNATTHDIYQTPFIMSSGKNGTACWVATPWKQISFFLPCWTCLLLNIVLLGMIARVIIRSARTGSSSAGHAREVKALMTIGITVGVPWVFAALTFGAIAQTFQWLFIILANLQGPIMFVCYVIFQEDVISNIFGIIGKSPPKILTASSKARSAREISSMAKAQTSVTQVERDEKTVVEKEDESVEYTTPDENVYSNKSEAPSPDPDKVIVQTVASAPDQTEEPEYSDPVLESTSFPYRDTETDSQLDMLPPPPGNEEEIYENKSVDREDVDFVQSSYPHIPQLV